MGREIRMVPKDWEHPTYINEYRGEEARPMFNESFKAACAEWDESKRKWDNREDPYAKDEHYEKYTFEEWHGERPDNPDYYMPDWPADERTHLMMYENTSEGTPLSPAFETPEELARWLAGNGASSFGSFTASYEEWLTVCRGGWAPSGGIQDGEMMGGVELMHKNKQDKEAQEPVGEG